MTKEDRKERMNVQGFQKMTLLDFPGKIACTVFTGGCNLRCPFCHNAGLVLTPSAGADMEREVLEYVTKRKNLLDGVCITGGEPLLQPDLAEFIAKIKALGLAVKLDTNGSMPKRLKALLDTGTVDYVAMDIKASPARYARAVGLDVDVSSFLESIRILKESGVSHEFRTTAVKGIHEPWEFKEIAELVGDSPFFIQRFVDSGNLLGEGCSAFSEDEGIELLRLARERAPQTRLRGQDEPI